jgi:hypothetical protein
MSAKKKVNRKRSKPKGAAGKRKGSSIKKSARKKPAARKKVSKATNRNRSSSAGRFSRQRRGTAQQSADLQGLSRREDVDSESVEELVEEGNIFEAGAVRGVEEADDADEREVHTDEVPEDDVPGEYLDQD